MLSNSTLKQNNKCLERSKPDRLCWQQMQSMESVWCGGFIRKGGYNFMWYFNFTGETFNKGLTRTGRRPEGNS